MTILSGHISPETAYVVPDYPYGFRLRCQIRYWLEYNPTRGFRFVSQTTNPKKGDVWNKPKASTYCRWAGAMFLNEENHVQWTGLSEYSNSTEIQQWLEIYGVGLPEAGRKALDVWTALKTRYEQAHAERKVDWVIRTEPSSL